MNFSTTREFLDALLGGAKPSPDDVKRLMTEFSLEGQYLDYKNGNQDAEPLRNTVKKWTMGFANADGGVLAIGISEPDKASGKPREVVGIRIPGAATPTSWATSVLSPYVGRLSSPLAIESVEVDGHQVLFIATARASQLIAYAEGNEPRYALRIGDSTVNVPAYLISDLLLGRRNHPLLELSDVDFVEESRDPRDRHVKLAVRYRVENHSFVSAPEPSVAAVSWSMVGRDPGESRTLLQFIDPQPVHLSPGFESQEFFIVRTPAENLPTTIRPFERTTVQGVAALIPGNLQFGKMTFATYLMASGSMPDWYEVDVEFAIDNGKLHQEAKPAVRRCVARRATLSLMFK